MPVAVLPNVNLYYQLHGSSDAPPLLLAHGALATFETSWQHQIEPLGTHYRIIGVDLRGHGRSDNPLDQLDLRQMADDLAMLLDYLKYQSAHVCGFSGGASTALFFAQRHPRRLRSLVLVSNNFALDQARAEKDFWNIERVKRDKPEWWAHLLTIHKVGPAQLFRWWAQEDVVRPNFTAQALSQIQTSTLVIGGDRDPIIPLNQTVGLYQHLPNAQLAVFPRMGHGIPYRQPEYFNQLLLDFLNTHSSTQ